MNRLTSETKPCTAILYLPESKSRMVLVYGRSGKRYTFQANGVANGRPARVYDDPAVFEREELDIRRNLRGTMAVCTMVGSGDYLSRALAAIEGVAGSAQSIGRDGAKVALEQLQAEIARQLESLVKVEDPEPESQEIHDASSDSAYTKEKLAGLSINNLRKLARIRGGNRDQLVNVVLDRQAAASRP